jgi:hypothetical protein
MTRPTTPSPPNDARRHPRLDVRLAAEVRTARSLFTARTRNLSKGGCCLESSYPLQETDRIRVGLFVVVDGIEDETLPPMRVLGTVQWTAQNDEGLHVSGIQFVEMSSAQTAWLTQFLARQVD